MAKIDLSTALGELELSNPVLTASGTCGFGQELASEFQLSELGGLIVKGITVEPSTGNPPPRIVETPAGIINSIGLENPGIANFKKEQLPWLARQETKILANISGHSIADFAKLAAELKDEPGITGLEINVSCPNIGEGGLAFGTDPAMVYEVTSKVAKNYPGWIMVKLTPVVSDIEAVAQAAKEGGAKSLAVTNTLPALDIDLKRQKPELGNIYGGLSGPAIRPVALKLVYQLAAADILPILGVGGIMTGEDAVKFLLAGAKAIAVGTATLLDPQAALKIKEGIADYLAHHNYSSLQEIIGKAQQ